MIKSQSIIRSIMLERRLLNLAWIAISLNEKRSKSEVVSLVQNNIGLARTIAAQYANIHADYDDVQSHAHEALIRAAERYDPDQSGGAPFSGYASRVIHNELKRLYGKEMKYHSNELATLDAPIPGSSDGSTGATNIPDVGAVRPGDDSSRRELVHIMLSLMGDLSDNERLYIELYFINGMSYRAISSQVGVSPTAVSNTIHAGLKALRSSLEAKGVTKDQISFESLKEAIERNSRS